MNYGIREMVELEFKVLAAGHGLRFSNLEDLPTLAHLFYRNGEQNNIEWMIDGTMYVAWEAVTNAGDPERSCQILNILDAQYKCARAGLDTCSKDLQALLENAKWAWDKVNAMHALQHILTTCERLALPVSSLKLQEFFSFTAISQGLVDSEQADQGLNFPYDIGFKFDTAMYLFNESMKLKEQSASGCRIMRRSLMLMWEEDHNPPTCSDMTENEQRRQLSRGYMANETTQVLQKVRA